MEIFIKGYKVNFVDKNDVVIGYDIDSYCCEEAGYIFAKSIPDDSGSIRVKDIMSEPKDFGVLSDDVIFDADFLKKINDGDPESTQMVVFCLLSESMKTWRGYLILFNCHNGYYSHGFTVKTGNEVILKGEL